MSHKQRPLKTERSPSLSVVGEERQTAAHQRGSAPLKSLALFPRLLTCSHH